MDEVGGRNDAPAVGPPLGKKVGGCARGNGLLFGSEKTYMLFGGGSLSAFKMQTITPRVAQSYGRS